MITTSCIPPPPAYVIQHYTDIAHGKRALSMDLAVSFHFGASKWGLSAVPAKAIVIYSTW